MKHDTLLPAVTLGIILIILIVTTLVARLTPRMPPPWEKPIPDNCVLVDE